MGDLAGEGIEHHVQGRHFAAGWVEVGAIKVEMTVDLGSGQEGAAGSASGVKDGLTRLGAVAEGCLGHEGGDGFGSEELGEW